MSLDRADGPPREGMREGLPDRRSRLAAGKRLRETVPRQAHAGWQPAAERADPVSILEAQGALRIPELLPIRYGRMRASPLAFLRGAAAIMAADLAGTPASGLQAQSCGDCHLANFGSYEMPEGLAMFDVNDFDETLRAPFEWDVKRLATSLVLAGREHGLSRSGCRRLARRAVRAYGGEVVLLSRLAPLDAWNTRIDLADAIASVPNHRTRERLRTRLNAHLRGASRHFGLVDYSGSRPILREKPPLAIRLSDHEQVSRSAFARYVSAQPPDRRLLLDRYRLEDVLFKVVGVGSVGTFCAIGLFASGDNAPLLLQIKEAQPSVLEAFVRPSPFRNAGERVVQGQRIMQAASDPFLGWTFGAERPEDEGHAPDRSRQFYVRQLKDSRLAAFGTDIEADALESYGILCGRVLGRAHARSADAVAIGGYLGSGRSFADAVASFAASYADQTEQDWQALNEAIVEGRLAASSEPAGVLSF